MARDEFNITGIFDGLFSGIARETGVPEEDWSAIFGGQLYGSIIDIISDVFLTPAASAVLEGFVGLGTILYSAFAEGVDPRLRKELFSMGTKVGLEVIDPRSWEAKKASADVMMSKINEGDIIGAIFKPPEELEKLFGLKKEKPPVKKVKSTKEEVEEKVVVEVPVEEENVGEENVEEEEEEKWRKLSA